MGVIPCNFVAAVADQKRSGPPAGTAHPAFVTGNMSDEDDEDGLNLSGPAASAGPVNHATLITPTKGATAASPEKKKKKGVLGSFKRLFGGKK
jgi:hypothetical protein